MTIINANHYLEQLLAPAALERIAQLCKFCSASARHYPAMLVPALLRAMGATRSMTLPVYTVISMPCS